MKSMSNRVSPPLAFLLGGLLLATTGCGAPAEGLSDAPELARSQASSERPRPVRLDQDQDGSPVWLDCDDQDPSSYPGAMEKCDARDNDCNGLVDDDAADAQLFYPDDDRDGYGSSTAQLHCVAPAGWVATSGDCDDSRSDVNPAAVPSCDGVDTNCNGSIEDEFWYCESISDDPSGFDPGDGEGSDDPSGFDPGPGEGGDDPSGFDPGPGDGGDDPSGFDL